MAPKTDPYAEFGSPIGADPYAEFGEPIQAAQQLNVPKPPNPLEGVSGYDALGPVKDTFSTKVGERIKGNFDLPAQVSALSEAAKSPNDGTGKQMAMPWGEDTLHATAGIATIGPRMVWNQVKQYAQNPASLVGDVVSGVVAHNIAAPTAPKPSIPEAPRAIEPIASPRPKPTATPGVGRAVADAAIEYGKHKIPGYHVYRAGKRILDAVTPEVPKAQIAAPEPAVPAHFGKGKFGTPVSEWGTQFEPEPVKPAAPKWRDATRENAAFAGEEIPKAPQFRDATKLNTEFAGEEAPGALRYRDATRVNAPYAGEEAPIAPPEQPYVEPVWPENYRNAPKTLDSSGGGGANYTAEDLAKVKQEMGIEVPEHRPLEDIRGDLKSALRDLGGTQEPLRNIKAGPYEYRRGQFFKDGQVLETGEEIADAVSALDMPQGKIIEGQASFKPDSLIAPPERLALPPVSAPETYRVFDKGQWKTVNIPAETPKLTNPRPKLEPEMWKRGPLAGKPKTYRTLLNGKWVEHPYIKTLTAEP